MLIEKELGRQKVKIVASRGYLQAFLIDGAHQKPIALQFPSQLEQILLSALEDEQRKIMEHVSINIWQERCHLSLPLRGGSSSGGKGKKELDAIESLRTSYLKDYGKIHYSYLDKNRGSIDVETHLIDIEITTKTGEYLASASPAQAYSEEKKEEKNTKSAEKGNPDEEDKKKFVEQEEGYTYGSIVKETKQVYLDKILEAVSYTHLTLPTIYSV
eukprot:TRINITY_DN6796_c0_g2_i3.p1 TRINITY_DN6796_c0_g2~~TRINITY_DN6796_c0_g2_i3.p1  ORF type:complete len:215 (+),score=54.51 TRINITY_DN6796_c0_g2_i3:64-708(+)